MISNTNHDSSEGDPWGRYNLPRPMDGSTGRQVGKARQGHRWHRRQELRRIQATRRRVRRGQELPGSVRSSTELETYGFGDPQC